MLRVVKVAVEQATYHFDKLYSYTVDSTVAVTRGCRVLVPFGRGDRCRQGIVMELGETPETATLKKVVEVLDEQPLLSDELLSLALWLKERAFCTVFDAVRAMLPTGLYWNVKPVFLPVRPLPDGEEEKLSPEALAVYKLACTVSGKFPEGIPGDKLLRLAGLTNEPRLLESMLRHGWLTRSADAFRRSNDATRRMARLCVSAEKLEETLKAEKCSPKQRAVVSLLEAAGTASVKELCYLAGVTEAVVQALVKKGIAELYEQEWLRTPSKAVAEPVCTDSVLQPEQQKAYEQLVARYGEEAAACALLYGVTGSGKTQVYMKLIDRVIADGKQVIVLVPEISLTPQLTEQFFKRYGAQVAVLHSSLSVGERMDEWKRIRRGEAAIVVGTRSAVFAPVSRLGLIVIDEEQEHTYKSESTPRYHAREVAKFRCAQHKALLLLSSATPCVESYHAAKSGRYSLHTLTTRYGDAVLPQVDVVDMRTEVGSVFSEPLLRELRTCFENNRQAILLLNRRGYQTFVSCRSCGKVITCPSCSISMTYHRANGKLMCHYCGHMQSVTQRCPDCGSEHVRYSGIGTQRVEEELLQHFPDIRVLRMDTDTTMSRFAYEEKFKEFAGGGYQVMIGTQMVAKGLDFPNVSLVGVLSADQSLYAGDYRAYETTFSLLTQVIGRAGRREFPGKAVIQTTVPDHYVIGQASQQDYDAFYDVEIAMRKQMRYPPFTELCVFGLSGTREAAVREASGRLLALLRETVKKPEYQELPLIVLDPTPAAVVRVSGKYRYKLLVKSDGSSRSRQLIGELLRTFNADAANREVAVYADRNPATIL